MSTKDILVSQKFNNYNYAPGIATYGIDGKTGESGKDGNNIYFTDFNLKNITDLKYFASLLVQNYLPLENSIVQIERTYKNNDLFFDLLGIIYRLKNIESLLNNDSLASWDSYFDIAGRLTIANNSSLFTMMDNNRLILNSSLYGGYDIISGLSYNDASNNINKNSVVNIISNKVNENDDIEMINIQSVDDIDIEDGKLSVYYKTTENAFYLDSNKPIIINGDVKLNNDEPNIEYDNYSTILTSNDTISYFKHICDKLKYSIIYDDQTNQYILSIYQEDANRGALDYLVNRKETVFGKVYTDTDDQILIKLSDVINGKVLSSTYNDYMPTYDITSLSPTISKSDFNIKYIKVDNSSIYIDYVVNSYNKSLSVDVSLDVDLLPSHIVAQGTAASSSTLEDTIGSYKIYSKLDKEQNSPYGIAFGVAMSETNGFIEITPIDKIHANDILNVSVYTTTSEVNDLYAKIWVDGSIFETTKELNPIKSGERDTNKNIYSLSYTFDVDVNHSIRIGFPNKNFRLHKYVISDLTITNTNSSTYYKKQLLNKVFGVEASYVKEGNEYELDNNGDVVNASSLLKTAFTYNKNGQYKFSFNTKNIKENNGEKFIYLNIIPLMNYNGNSPVQIIFKVPNDLNGTYTLYFTIQHSDLKFSISNIMLDNENGVLFFDDDTRYCIQTYLPDNVNSVKKFSLLHNTEIFIDYWNEIPNDENYDNLGEITSTYMYKLLSYNSKDYVDTGELVISYDKYYLYSGETTIWNGLLCYIWDRYEDGENGGMKSEDMPKINDNDPKVYECKILTNTLDVKMPLTTASDEYVASLTAYDTDISYDLLAAQLDSIDYGLATVPGGLPEMYQGIRILQKIKK